MYAINSVRLRNWRSHLDSEFLFSEGVNALLGIMGSGKTSVLQGIVFALFGIFPQLQSKKIRLEDIIMKRPQEKSRAEVEIEFTKGDDVYYVKRVVQKQKGGAKTTHAEIRKNGEIIDVTPQGVTAAVEAVLQADYSLFSKAIYSEQDGMDAFLRLPRGQRTVQIDRMLQLDLYEKARENAVSLVNRLRQIREEKAKTVSDLEKERIEERISEVEREIKEMEREMEIIKEKQEKAEKEKAKLHMEVEMAEKTERELNDVRSSLESARSALKEVAKGIENRERFIGGIQSPEEKLKKSKADAERIEEIMTSLKNEGKNANRRLAEAGAEKENTMKALEEAKKEFSEKLAVQKELEEIISVLGEHPEIAIKQKAEELEEKRANLHRIEAEKKEKENHIRHLRERERCPVCETEISKERKKGLIEEKQKAVKEAEKKAEELKKQTSLIEKELEVLNEKYRRFGVLKEKSSGIKEIEKRIGEHSKKIEELEEAEKEAEKIAENTEKKLRSLELLLDEKKAEQERLAAVIREAEELKGLWERKKHYEGIISFLEVKKRNLEEKASKADIRHLRSLLEEASGKVRELLAREEAGKEKIAYRESYLNELRKRAEIAEKYRREAKNTEKCIEALCVFINVLKFTQNQMREEFVSTINAIMDAIWPELYPYGDLEGVRLVVEDDYVLQVRERENWIPVELVSGGEKSLAVLALRIAFSLAFTPNLKWLILDEPTHNLDVNAIQNFSEILRERIGQFANQVFLITHEERICEGLDGNVYRLERDKESNGPTVAVRI